MSFSKTYLVEFDMPKPTLNHFYAIVTSGNSRGALQKFLLHMDEIPGYEPVEFNTEFISHVTLDNQNRSTPKKTYKEYYNKDHSVKIIVRQINPHDDFIYAGGIIMR